MASDVKLGPCPKCGKRAGKVHDAKAGRFPFFVMCGNCTWSTGGARTEGIAVQLWQDAKPAAKGRARARKKIEKSSESGD